MGLNKTRNLRAAVIGKDGRTTALRRLLMRSPRIEGGIECLSTGKAATEAELVSEVLAAANRVRPDFVVVGPEEPLALGIVDALWDLARIPCVGPTRALAQVESSKAFTRNLLAKYKIAGNPRFEVFGNVSGLADYLSSLGEFVVKPDGLTGGKGVKVSGEHLNSIEEAVDYANELFGLGQQRVVIEEKLEGEEFSLQSFTDGVTLLHTQPVQDHKRALEGDCGPNTGGMGSYSCATGTLPFLNPSDVTEARRINEDVVRALHLETGKRYRGVLFGGFMATSSGVRLLEFNARLGDPESLNVLSTLQSDFADLCLGVLTESLASVSKSVLFAPRSTVCKYLVPNGYPDCPVRNELIDPESMPIESENLRIYNAAVEESPQGLRLMGSRAVAVVGLGASVDEAFRVVDDACAAVRGPVRYRKDIGSRELIGKRVAHMRRLRPSPFLEPAAERAGQDGAAPWKSPMASEFAPLRH